MKTMWIVLIMTALAGACIAAEKLQPPPVDLSIVEPEKTFDISFAGGTPRQLSEAVEKATKMPLNVIIPDEYQDFALPPLKLRNVTVPQLFGALTMASLKLEERATAWNAEGWPTHYQRVNTKFGFKTPNEPPRANSIWYFYVEGPPAAPRASPPAPQPVCRFWQLEPYLEKLKVEDITTAIETGWKMLGVNPVPKLSFHKDTKLLIVVGQQKQLSLVDDVLRELTGAKKQNQFAPTPAGQIPGVVLPKN